MMKITKLDTNKPDNLNKVIEESIYVLQNGGIIVYPTDTAYGLGADIYKKKAVKKIYEMKGRNKSLPLSVMVADMDVAEKICYIENTNIRKAAGYLIPGPVTIVMKAKDTVPEYLKNIDKTVGFRIPKHDFCLKLLKKYKHPITTTSANISGKPEAKRITDIDETILNNANLIIDGGTIESEKVSTVIRLDKDGFEILREGALDLKDIINILKDLNITKM